MEELLEQARSPPWAKKWMDIDGVGGSRVIDKRVRARPEETYLVRHPSNDQKREDIEKFFGWFLFSIIIWLCVNNWKDWRNRFDFGRVNLYLSRVEMDGMPAEVVNRRGLYDVTLYRVVHDRSLRQETIFECVLSIPATQYQIARRLIYYLLTIYY
jgi:hypothetical protein